MRLTVVAPSDRRHVPCTTGQRPPMSARALIAVVLVWVTAVSPVAHGGPSIIRDEMLQDTAITPTLGRGYSIATNTYQSTCLVDVVSTTPSYDFDYTFE